MSAAHSYEYYGFNIRIACYRRPKDNVWMATYLIKRATDGPVATNGAAGGFFSPEEAEAGAKKAAHFWVDNRL